MQPKALFTLLLVTFLSASCIGQRNTRLLRESAPLNIPDELFGSFDAGKSEELLQYLCCNPRWEVREEDGIRFAIRQESLAGKFETTRDGFYSEMTSSGNYATTTQVILSFERPLQDAESMTTKAKLPATCKRLLIAEPDGITGYSSHLVVEGNGLFLQIFESSPEARRQFTILALEEIARELTTVGTYIEKFSVPTSIHTVQNKQVLDAFYPKAASTRKSLEVTDGFQSGIYFLSSSFNPRRPGFAFVRVFDDSGNRLSSDSFELASKRFVGWSDSDSDYFEYAVEFMVGFSPNTVPRNKPFTARIEVWHNSNGSEKMALTTTQTVERWQR